MTLEPHGRSSSAARSGLFGASDRLFWAVLVTISLIPIASDLKNADGLILPQGVMIGRDFLNAWAAGQLTVQGQIGTIYSIDGYLQALGQLIGHPIDFHAFSYPPTLLLFLWPLGLLGYLPALVIWIAGTITALLLAARPYLARKGLPLWIPALLPASIVNIWAGHHGFVLAALWLAAFAVIPRRPLVAGLLIALLTLKPHMGLLIPLLLILRREWGTFGAAALGTLAIAAISVAAFGFQPWIDYVQATAPMQTALLAQGGVMYLQMMPTPYVSFWVTTYSVPFAIAMHAMFAGAALTVLVRGALRDTPWPELGLMAATATFLVLPYAFNYDMVVVGLSAAILLYGHGSRLGPIDRLVTLLALGTPILVLMTNGAGIPLLPFALLGFLLVQAKCYVQRAEAQPLQEPAQAAAA